MGCYRMPSPTPSVGSDAPIPETLQDDPPTVQNPPGARTRQLNEAFTEGEAEQPAAKKPRVEDSWVVYVGNLHPHTNEVDLHNLFNGGNTIASIAIRTTRGCGVIPIPEEAMVSSDRCYASVVFNNYKAYCRALRMDNPRNPPILHGLPILIKLSPADMPEVKEILKRTVGLFPVNGTKRTKRKPRKSKRITIQKTEIVEDPSPLAGPSNKGALPKPR